VNSEKYSDVKKAEAPRSEWLFKQDESEWCTYCTVQTRVEQKHI